MMQMPIQIQILMQRCRDRWTHRCSMRYRILYRYRRRDRYSYIYRHRDKDRYRQTRIKCRSLYRFLHRFPYRIPYDSYTESLVYSKPGYLKHGS